MAGVKLEIINEKEQTKKPDITRKSILKKMKKAMRADSEFLKAQGLTRVKENQQSNVSGTQEEIETAKRIARTAGCSVEKSLITLQKVRKQNDEMAEKLGYQRTGNLANGVAMFSKSV